MISHTDMELITKHIQKTIGKIDTVFHEIVSDDLHIDICHVKSGFFKRYEVLVTMGMSAKPMNVPDECDDPKFIELMILLPKGWPLKKENFFNENSYWPIRLLKDLARFAHYNNTFLSYAHTVANAESENDLTAYADNNNFCASILLPSITIGEKSFVLERGGEGNDIYFFSVISLYEKELLFKLENEVDMLIDLFDRFRISDIVDINRQSVVT
jgi:hypothetical protein